MSDIKFTCEGCGQPIAVDAKEAGRKFACPNCKLQLTVPRPSRPPREGPARKRVPRPAPKAIPTPDRVGRGPGAVEPAGTANAAPSLEAPPKVRMVSTPDPKPGSPIAAAGPPERATAPTTGAEAPKPGLAPPAASPVPPPEKADVQTVVPATGDDVSGPAPAQVAVLTAETKRDIVRGVREFLADGTRWMPGVDDDGRLAYGRKRGADGAWERVDVESGEADHFSLMGAVVLELHRRSVAPTARGRVEFLDQEIPDGLRRAVMGAEGGGAGENPAQATDPRILGASHAQCLRALELLEADYGEACLAEGGGVATEAARGDSIEELLVRSAKDEVVTAIQVLKAVHWELTQLERRVTALEQGNRGRPPESAS